VTRRAASRIGDAVVAAFVAIIVAIGLAAGVASAQTTTTTTAPPGVGVTLLSQTPWTPLAGAFTMTLRVDRRAQLNSDIALAVRVHTAKTTRSSFDGAVQNGELGRSISEVTLPLASIPRDAHGNLVVRLGLVGGYVDTAHRLVVTAPGSYPVEVALTNTNESGSFVTWLVAVDMNAQPPIDKRLQVGMVWQLTASPAFLPNGAPDPRVFQAMQPGGRLDHITSLLERVGGAPYSLGASPETIESWSRLARSNPKLAPGLQRIRTAVLRPTTQLLPTPYVPIDGTALEAEGLGYRLPDEFLAGANALQDVTGARPDAGTVFVDPADDAAIDRQRSMLADRVVIRDSALVSVNHAFSPAQTFELTTAQGRSLAATTAPFVESLFNGNDPPALKAARVLAALSEVAYETPAIARGLVIASPDNWNPDVATVSTVVAALRGHPLLQAATLDQFFAEVPAEQQADGSMVERQLLPSTPGSQPITQPEYAASDDELTSYRAVVGAEDPTVIAGEHALLVALSTSISTGRARTELNKIDNAVQRFASGITTSSRRITLTARRAAVPLSFQNTTTKGRVRVRVHLESPKLTFPDGPDRVLDLPPGNQTVRFSVEARASGTFPMTVTLTSEDGSLAFGAPTRVTVRSAVFGGYAIALTVGALAFLAFWWGNHILRTRRLRRTPPAPAS
jgi:Family of unknown function (DUF6049)